MLFAGFLDNPENNLRSYESSKNVSYDLSAKKCMKVLPCANTAENLKYYKFDYVVCLVLFSPVNH